MSSTRRPGLGVPRRLRLRDVVLFSLPPFVAALYLLGASVGDYRQLRQFDDWWSQTARVDRFAWWRVRSALRLPRAHALDASLTAEDRQRALVDLRVDRDEFDRMASDPVGRAGMSVKGELVAGNSSQEVEVKLRGDTSVHWTGEKKTLAIKSDRGEMFHQSRVNVFSAKEVLAQFASNSMAADFGLLAPPTAVVPVFLNQRFAGMYRAFAPLDETFLRNAGRVPGNIFRGDTAERGDYFKGLPRELFVNPYIWDRVAKNDRPGAIGTAKLFEFVARVNQSGSNEVSRLDGFDAATSKLFEFLDRDEIARLFALDLCVGDPWHTSGVHNHFWYEDSSSGLLHPIPWDLRMLDLERPPPGAQFNRFWRAALRDPRVFATALEAIHERNKDGALLKSVTERVESTWQRYRDGFEYDRLRCGPTGTAANSDVGSPEEVLGLLRKNLATMETWISDARASIAMTALDADTLVLDVQVSGRAPIHWYLQAADKQACRVTADADLDGVPSAGDRAADNVMSAGEAAEFDKDGAPYAESLWPGVRARKGLEQEAISYRYFVKSPRIDRKSISLLFTNAITGGVVDTGVLVEGSPCSAPTSIHPWTIREPIPSEVRLEGEVHLTHTLEIPREKTLVIAPGAKLVLDPNVSIHCKGQVQALGTEALPISISSSDPRHPWGSFAMWGEGANSSQFTNVHFSGGGGALLDDVEYTGMVCVHWARKVVFRNCEFFGNQRCDDALHADLADVVVSHCWFHDTNSDALDLDISTATVEFCKVERAGNDGFDLMTCSPRIIGNEIRDNLDKGISVGENSSPFVFANTISGCKRGIEVKDRSAPVILNNTIEKNGVGILARLKNWRYERGGWPRLVRTSVTGNKTNLELEAKTRLTPLDVRLGDAEAESKVSSSLDWLYALNGVAIDAPSIGAVPAWRSVPQAVIFEEESFPDTWSAPEATWKISGGVTSLRVSEECLVVRMNARAGALRRKVDWHLIDPACTNWLVLESSSTDLEAVHVRVEGQDQSDQPHTLANAMQLADGASSFAWTVVPLPAGIFGSLSLEVTPRQREAIPLESRSKTTGQLRLHRWFIVRALTADLGPAK